MIDLQVFAKLLDLFGPGRLSDVASDVNSPTTAGLYRYRTPTESYFVKAINSSRSVGSPNRPRRSWRSSSPAGSR